MQNLLQIAMADVQLLKISYSGCYVIPTRRKHAHITSPNENEMNGNTQKTNLSLMYFTKTFLCYINLKTRLRLNNNLYCRISVCLLRIIIKQRRFTIEST